MKKFFDFEMCFYIVFFMIFIVIISWGNNNTKTKCEKAGGQLVEHTGKFRNSCIYPPKGK
jgi:hypothetical protein